MASIFDPGFYGGRGNTHLNPITDLGTPGGGYGQEGGYTQPIPSAKPVEDPRVADARAQYLKLTQDRAKQVQEDPQYKAATAQLAQMGANGPLDAATVTTMKSRAADSSAAGASGQQQQLRNQMAMSGGNPNDPSFQAAMREIDSGRQQANQNSSGAIDVAAAQSNNAAKLAALSQLNNMKDTQYNQAQHSVDQTADYYSKVFADTHTPDTGDLGVLPNMANFSGAMRYGGTGNVGGKPDFFRPKSYAEQLLANQAAAAQRAVGGG